MRTFTSFNQPLLFHGSRAVLNKENKDPEKKQDQEGNKEKDEEKSKPEEKEQGKNKKKDMDQDEKDIRDQIRENLKKKNPNLDPNNIKIYQLDNKSLARAFAGIFFFSLFLTFLLASNQRNENELSFQDFKTNYLERGLVTKLTVVNKFAVEAQLIQGAVSDQTFQTFSGHPAVVFHHRIGRIFRRGNE